MHCFQVIALAAAALIVLLAQVKPGAADCCGAPFDFGNVIYPLERCADCTRPREFYCGVAGGGGCNMLGCNCGGGCIQPVPGRECSASCCDKRQDRHGRRSRRGVTSGTISMPTGNYTGHDVVIAADLDNNGHLDAVEVHLYLTQRGVHVNDVTAWQKLDADADGRLTATEIDNDLRGL